MSTALVFLGVLCVIAAIVVGGVKAAQIEFSLVRQIFLAIAGLGVGAVGYALSQSTRSPQATAAAGITALPAGPDVGIGAFAYSSSLPVRFRQSTADASISDQPAQPEGAPPPSPLGQGCDSKCTSSPSGELKQALAERALDARRCTQATPSLKGTITLILRVAPAGNVCSAHMTSTDIGSLAGAAAVKCVHRIFGATSYPPPGGDCVVETTEVLSLE